MIPVNMAIAMNGRGSKKGMMEAMTRISSSSANMFPKRRMESETGREKWLMISMGTRSGAKRGMGPVKCLRYLNRPWDLIPCQW